MSPRTPDPSSRDHQHRVGRPASAGPDPTSALPAARRPRRALVLAAAALTAVGLAACGGSDDGATTTAAGDGATRGAAATSAARRTTYPVTLRNCGREVTFDAAPKRVVSVNQGSTEILLSLGLADRLVGTATWTDAIRPNLARANAGVRRLSDDGVAPERVLAAEPDLVTASFAGSLEENDPGQRDRYAKLGVATYVSPSACENRTDASGDGPRSAPLRMGTIYAEVRELARIFDVADRGERLVADLRRRMDRATTGVRGRGASVAYWFANTEAPYMAGCCGSPGIMSRALGVKNAFADTHTEWPQVSWESVLQRDPTVLVLGDLRRKQQTGDALKDKIRFLETNPVTKRLTAVRERRYVVMNGADMNPSIRTVDGVEKLAKALRERATDGSDAPAKAPATTPTDDAARR